MIDFKKLMDPEYQAKVRAEMEQESERQKKETQRVRAMIDALADAPEGRLNEAEARFIRSLGSALAMYGAPSPKQLAWLERLHKQHCEPVAHDSAADQPKRFTFIRPR